MLLTVQSWTAARGEPKVPVLPDSKFKCQHGLMMPAHEERSAAHVLCIERSKISWKQEERCTE